MSSFNKVILMGTLTRDVEIRHAGQTPVADLGIALNRQYYNKSTQQTVKDTTFVDVTVWGKTAENCARYLSKGRQCMVEGRLQLDEWEQDGQRRSKLKVVAENVQFIGSAKQDKPSRPQAQPAGNHEPINSEDIPF